MTDATGTSASSAVWPRVLLIWLALSVLSIMSNIAGIIDTRFPDPDDLLRLQQVRDWMAGQSWFDVHQYRIDPPHGAAMHWTRLIDPPIALVILLVQPLFGQYVAETAALVVVPLVTLACALALVARFTCRIFGEKQVTFACLVFALPVPLMHQLRPLRIDHHGWQIVMAMIALNASFARNPRTGGTVAGLALAFWLAISIEGLPVTVAFMGVYALRWLRDPRDSAWLTYGITSLAGGSALFWAVSHEPAALLRQYCDVISAAHLAALFWCAAGCWLSTRFGGEKIWPRVFSLGLVAASALLVIAALAPQCATGNAFAELDPVVRKFWFIRVHEGLPIWHQALPQQVQLVGIPLVAIYGIAQLARAAKPNERQVWQDYLLLVSAALAAAIMVERASAVVAAFAVPAAAVTVRGWLNRARTMKTPLRRIGAMLLSLMALAPALPILALLETKKSEQTLLEKQMGHSAKCEMVANLQGLNALPASDFLSTLDTSPAIVFASHHRVVASGHHRSSAAMRDVIDAFRGTDEEARTIVRRRGIEYVAICPGLFEPMIYRAQAPNGFMARLWRGQIPQWLEPVRLKGVKRLRIYKVINQPPPHP